jgi:hypothetical protein
MFLNIADTLVGRESRRRSRSVKCSTDDNRPYLGALKSAFSQPADSDVIGSVATVMTWIYVHFRHSNERMSQPFDPGMIRISIILVVHFGHGGCSTKICEGAYDVE